MKKDHFREKKQLGHRDPNNPIIFIMKLEKKIKKLESKLITIDEKISNLTYKVRVSIACSFITNLILLFFGWYL